MSSTLRLVVGAVLIGWCALLAALIDWPASLGRDGPPEMFDH